MTWQAGSADLISKHLGLEVSQFNMTLIATRQADVLQWGGQAAVDRVESYLQQLETIEGNLTANAGQANVKVLGIGSGLEYFQGGERAGLQKEYDRIVAQVGRAMRLEYVNVRGLPTGWGAHTHGGGGRTVRA